MKKLLVTLLMFAMIFTMAGTFAACGGAEEAETYELALVTDVGTIDDKSFNQGAWEGLVQYAEENSITHKYYQPTEKSTEAYVEAIGLAVDGGAKVIVCPGFLFEPAVFEAQDLYPDTKFIILDGFPHNGDYNPESIKENVYSIFFKEDQAGFLAGYAAVKGGSTKLGFVGGMAVPAVVKFGYGYIQGAEFAAKEMGVKSLEIKYHYTGGFAPTPEAETLAASWYNAGTEVIFAAAGGAGNSVMAAAEAAEKGMIGVDVDQSSQSDAVITSAMKALGVGVYDGLKAYYDDMFPGGKIVSLGADTDGIGLPMDTTKIDGFTQADYDAVYAQLADGTIKVMDDTTKLPTDFNSTIVKIIEVK